MDGGDECSQPNTDPIDSKQVPGMDDHSYILWKVSEAVATTARKMGVGLCQVFEDG